MMQTCKCSASHRYSFIEGGLGGVIFWRMRKDLAVQPQASSPGRVPHVRLSVHGPKKMGRSPSNDLSVPNRRTS
jgi:hypothetical protein